MTDNKCDLCGETRRKKYAYLGENIIRCRAHAPCSGERCPFKLVSLSSDASGFKLKYPMVRCNCSYAKARIKSGMCYACAHSPGTHSFNGSRNAYCLECSKYVTYQVFYPVSSMIRPTGKTYWLPTGKRKSRKLTNSIAKKAKFEKKEDSNIDKFMEWRTLSTYNCLLQQQIDRCLEQYKYLNDLRLQSIRPPKIDYSKFLTNVTVKPTPRRAT